MCWEVLVKLQGKASTRHRVTWGEAEAAWLVRVKAEKEDDRLNCRSLESCDALKSKTRVSSLMSQRERNWGE